MNDNERKRLEEAKAQWAEAWAAAMAAQNKAAKAHTEAWVAMWAKVDAGKALAALDKLEGEEQ